MKNIRRISKKYYLRQIVACFLTAYMLFGFPMQMAQAAPTGGSWDVGSGTIIDGIPHSSVTVFEAESVIDWGGFNTASGESVTFTQGLMSNSAVLNKIMSGGITNFNGALSASDMRIFIVNPSGVIFGPTSSVNANQLVASSMKMSNAAFHDAVNGEDMVFTNPSSYNGARVVANYGAINAADSVYLVGKNVLNAGTIITNPGGLVAMVAGDEMVLAQPGSPIIVKTLKVNNIENHTVDNGGLNNPASNLELQFGYTNPYPQTGSVSTGELVLAAGDVWSNAIDNVQDLTATARGDIHFEEAINITGDLKAQAGLPTQYDSDWDYLGRYRHPGDYYKTKHYEEYGIEVKQGGDVHAKGTINAGGSIEVLANGIQLDAAASAGPDADDDMTLTGRWGEDPVDGFHNIETAALTAGGNIDISVTGVTDQKIWEQGDWDWERTGGCCSGRWVHPGEWVGNPTPTYEPGTITLNGDVTAIAGNLTLYNDTTVTLPATLSAGTDLVLLNSSDPYENAETLDGTSSLTLIAGNEIQAGNTTISVTGSKLTMQQGLPLDTAGYLFANQENTHLTLISDDGSVTSDSGDNAANKWASIGAHAQTDIELGKDGGSSLEENTIFLGDAGIDGEDISLLAETGSIEIYGDTGNTGDDAYTVKNHDDYSDWAIEAGQNIDIQAVHEITLGGDATAHSGYMNLQADIDKRYGSHVWAKGTLSSGTTMDIEGTNVFLDEGATAGGDMTIVAHGLYGIANSPDEYLQYSGDVTAGGKLESETGKIEITAIRATGNPAETLTGYNVHDHDEEPYNNMLIADYENTYTGSILVKDVEAETYIAMTAGYDIETDTVDAGTTLDIRAGRDITLNNATDSYTQSGSHMMLKADLSDTAVGAVADEDGDVLVKGTVTALDDGGSGTSMWMQAEDITLEKAAKAYNGDMILMADFIPGSLDGQFRSDSTLTTYGGGSIEIMASDNTISLGGDVTASVANAGDIILHNNTVADDGVVLAAGDDIYAGGDDSLLVSNFPIGFDDVSITGLGDLTLLSGQNGDGYGNILLGGEVTTDGLLTMIAGVDGGWDESNVKVKGLVNTGLLWVQAGDDIEFYSNVQASDHIVLTALDDVETFNGSNITMTKPGTSIFINAGDDGGILGAGDRNVEITGNVDSAGGVTISADDHVDIDGYVESGSGYINIFADEGDGDSIGDLDIDGYVDSGRQIYLYAGDDITLGSYVDADMDILMRGNMNADGQGNVTVAGDITSGGNIDIYSADETTFLYGDYVDAGGSVHLHNTTYAEGDIIAGQDIITDGELTLNGESGFWLWGWWIPLPKDQTMDAGENIYANNHVTKTTWGDLEMLAGDNVELDLMKNLTVMLGKLDVTTGDDIIFDGDVWSKYNMTLSANNDSVGSSFYANRTLTSLYGDVDISANGSWINLQDDVTAGDDIELHDHSRMTNWVEAVFEAGDDVKVDDGKALYAYGNLTVEAGDDITLGGYVSSYGDMLTLDAGDNVVVKGELNTLAAVATPYYNNGDVTVYADRNIEFRDNVQVGGRLEAYSGLDDESGAWFWYNSGAGSIEADGDVIADTMLLSAGAGLPGYSDSHVSVDELLQTTGGDMVVEAHHDILLGGNVDSAGNLTLNADRHPETGGEAHMFGGDVEVAGTVDAVGTIDMLGNNITLENDVTSGGDMTLTGNTSSDYAVSDPEGDVTAHGNLTSTGGSVSIYSSDDTTYLGGDVTAFADVLLNNNTRFMGFDDQHVTAQNGMITANGWLEKLFTSLYLHADGDISLADYVTAGCCLDGDFFGGFEASAFEIVRPQMSCGGVSIISDTGKIFTPGYGDTLNVAITGSSSYLLGTGVDLPYDNTKKAAIVIVSKEQDLKLGSGAELTACGVYDGTGTVDDRPGVDFLDHVEGAKNPGWPIDIAIYLASYWDDGGTGGDVYMDGPVQYIADGGAMVIDALNKVQPFGGSFIGSLMAGNVDWLEVCSRTTPTLNYAISYGTLPYADDLGNYPGTGKYVLRGEYPEGGTGAWVLASTGDVPLTTETGETAQRQTFGPGGCPALMQWLAGEIGLPADEIQVYFSDAYAYSTDIQPCETCARLRDASLILQDPEGNRIAALAQVINEYITAPTPPSGEQMAMIASTFAEHTGDATYYADASEWVDALAQYVGIMNSELGFTTTESMAFVGKYITPVTETGNASLISYVEGRISAL